jgi:beta-lactamase class A
MRAVSVCVLGLVLLACGGAGSSAPAPTSTSPAVAEIAATRTPEPPEATPTRVRTPSRVRPTPTPKCPDPYTEGAPYEATPPAPLRLRPAGSPPAVARYAPIPFDNDAALARVVRRAIRGDEGHVAVVIKDLDDGTGFTLDEDRSFYAASLYKTWVLLEAFHQRDAGLLDFDERYVVTDFYAREYNLNEGELDACDEVSVENALLRMMRVSDNVAANMVLDRVGPGNVNVAIRGLGLTASGFGAEGALPTTARDMALLLEAIARHEALNRAASEAMVLFLGSEVVDNRIPALLPKGTRVAHKTGSWENATHDVGIVYSPEARYVIVVLTDYSFVTDGSELIARLSKAVYDYYNPSE